MRGDHVALRQVELRDAAVRILHRAISHALEQQEAAALAALQGPKAREWYEDVSEYSGLTCVLSENGTTVRRDLALKLFGPSA